jgi:hypothetical protein
MDGRIAFSFVSSSSTFGLDFCPAHFFVIN